MAYDLIIIGSGPGGYVAAIRASQLGMKTAIVERAELGGICLNWGCIPTKALLKSAQVFEYLKHAADYGINVKSAEADFTAVVKRSRTVAEGMSKGVQFLMRKNKIDVIKGTGKVMPGKKVEVTDDKKTSTVYDAKNIIVAVGARSREVPSFKIDGKKIIGYREAMVLPQLPKSMVIIGSGAIGSEFAYFYATMGVKITLVEMLPNIVPVEDEEVSKQLAKSFTKIGIDVRTEVSVESVDVSGSGCKVKLKDKKGESVVECDIVLSAVGIAANLENIGLEQAGIITDKGKIAVNQFYQTNIPGYHAIGDCVKGQALAHVASAEGIICVEKMAGLNPEPLNYNNIPGCTYCQPEIASVGYTEKGAKEAGYELKIGKFPYSASGKASAAGAKDGFVKLIFDAKYGELLGAHLIGYNVTEMIAELVVARKLETTGHELLKAVHPHPTMSEAIMEAAAAAYGEVIHL
ncbi:MAG: dihydrolipoyl dehydrogenase [Bacteroidia bacterium]|jgi:dihydrolipoamide dehydrogenase|nr:dihydrolipoyl dehydrogenase [Bacteroidia bacterium]